MPTYDELVLVVREDEARTRGQDLRAFLQALTRGEREVRAEPGGGGRDAGQGEPVARSKAAARIDQADAARRRCRQTRASRSAGRTRRAWAAFGSWMYSHGLLKIATPSGGLPPFTNEFLPGEGI